MRRRRALWRELRDQSGSDPPRDPKARLRAGQVFFSGIADGGFARRLRADGANAPRAGRAGGPIPADDGEREGGLETAEGRRDGSCPRLEPRLLRQHPARNKAAHDGAGRAEGGGRGKGG